MSWVLIHWVLINLSLGLICSIFFIANMSSAFHPSSTGLAWLIAIFFFPIVGFPLYLIFGGTKLKGITATKSYLYRQEHVEIREYANPLEKILAFHKIPMTTQHNKMEIINNGETAYADLMELLERAQETIEIQTYIIGNDEVGDAILDKLVSKAKEGVIVRLLIDGLFAFVYPKGKLSRLRKAGVNVYLFLPLRFRIFRSRINLRNHRKLLIVDRKFAIMGGMNLAKNYMGPTQDKQRWRDIAVRLEGESVAQLTKHFCADWAFASGQSISTDYHGVLNPAYTSAIQVVASGPDVEAYPFYNTLLTAIFEAKKSIEVVSPYFVPDIALFRALGLAAFRGVQVNIIVPKYSNHVMTDIARACHIRYLIAAGVRFFFFEPTMLHAKVVTVDDEVAIVGSANFDMRSLFVNFEACVYLYSAHDIEAVKKWVNALKVESSDRPVYPDPGKLRLMLENLVSLISPLL